MPTGRLSGSITQDWEPVVLRRTKPKAADLKSAKAVNQALRSGAAVETVRKSAAGTNKHPSAAAAAPARKLDETTEPAAVERVAAEVRAAIQKARVAKGWSQAELAKRISERAQVVQEYEGGKAAPVQAVLAKMERALELELAQVTPVVRAAEIYPQKIELLTVAGFLIPPIVCFSKATAGGLLSKLAQADEIFDKTPKIWIAYCTSFLILPVVNRVRVVFRNFH
ncbi:Multiprotein-bridging factor 1c [Dichanthelium oligosanthes]|uniref:Multiprotein-bridging factor 1c n=1 Tax=Dichanthelium oligosanthes TaxID=888268 RepID=A0A1E5VDT5_9POAL|nr:Multiprotein-bridging factor 1c [Dichanthelium oligosanthes]